MALNASKAYFQESQKNVGNRDSTLKRHTHKHTHTHTKYHMLQDPEKMQKFERSLDKTHLLILQSFPERKKASGTHPGNQKLTEGILGSSSHHEDTATGKPHFHSSCQLTGIRTWPHSLALWHTHLGSPHAKQLPGREHRPIFQPASCHRTH